MHHNGMHEAKGDIGLEAQARELLKQALENLEDEMLRAFLREPAAGTGRREDVHARGHRVADTGSRLLEGAPCLG